MTAPLLLDHADALVGLLADWLPRQRWFGGKQDQIDRIEVVHAATWHAGGPDDPRLEHVVLGVASDGVVRHYQLLAGVRRLLPDRLDHVRIGDLTPDLVAYDATSDPDLTAVVLDLLAGGTDLPEPAGVRFTREPGVTLTTGLSSRLILSEQSNTSVVFGDEYILKLFRKLDTGVSPDLELHRALRGVESVHIAEPYAAIEGGLSGEPVTYGLLQQFFANSADGWSMATASVRDLIAEADLRADEVGGDFASEARRLGQAVATIHADLARALGTDTVPPDRMGGVVATMHERLDIALARVSGLAPFEPAIRAVFDEVTDHGEPVTVQRIHGDLHLGQALRTITRWVVIDFEGEPVRALADRAQVMSPLRDVAGMLRSFDYAAHHLLVDHVDDFEADVQLEYRAVEWAKRNRGAFCDGYASVGPDPRSSPVLLRALELDKAVYEVSYEYDNRPTWVDIPLRSIAHLATT